MSTTSATVLHAIADFERGREASRAKPSAVCRFTFTYQDSSIGPVTISKGEHVDPSHECIAARPDAFGIVHGKRKRSSRPELNAPQVITSKPDDALPGPSWSLGPGLGLLPASRAVELRSSPSPVTVHVGSRAREDITRHAEAVPRGYETGGMLIARRGHDRAHVRLIDAWGPGPTATHKRNTVALAWSADHDRARALADATDCAEIATGVWHVHPRGGAEPSEQDLAMFAAAMDDASARVWPLQTYVGLMATSVGRSAGPDLTAWVTREHHGQLVCERAVIA